MSNPWFRMYSEFSHDPKVQMLSEAMQRRYVMLMCLRCSDSLVTLHETEVAFHLRINNDEMAETKALFVAKGFIDSKWNLLNWEKRQFASDSSKDRVAKHRALQKVKQKDDSNVDVTLQDSSSNALDTEQNRTEQKLVPIGTLSSAKLPPCPHDNLIELFGEHLPTLPQPKKELWEGKNAEAMRARWKWVMTAKKKNGDRYATTKDEAIAWFARFFGHVAVSEFLSGRNDKWTSCDLGWFMKADNFAKVVSGNYDNKLGAA